MPPSLAIAALFDAEKIPLLAPHLARMWEDMACPCPGPIPGPNNLFSN